MKKDVNYENNSDNMYNITDIPDEFFSAPDFERLEQLLLSMRKDVKHRDTPIPRRNREWTLYDIPDLEACSKNSDKKRYNTGHLCKDLAFFCRYLTKDECNYIVHIVLFLIKEALKNYGDVSLANFGRFTVGDAVDIIQHNVNGTGKFTTKYYKLTRKLYFHAASYLRKLVTPIDLHYVTIRQNLEGKMPWPSLFSTWVARKQHRRLAKLFVLEAVNKQYINTPYSKDYIRAVATRELFDATVTPMHIEQMRKALFGKYLYKKKGS